MTRRLFSPVLLGNPRHQLQLNVIQLLFFFLFVLFPVVPGHCAVFNVPSGDVKALIGAMNNANLTAEDDTIILEPGVYLLTAVDNIIPTTPGAEGPYDGGPNGLPSVT